MTVPTDFDDTRGLQYERTALAWVRTALATVAVGLFMFRQTDAGVERWLIGAGIAVGLLGVLSAMRARTVVLHRRPSIVAPARVSVALVVGSLVVLSVAGIWVAF
jgi:uncharacterized membrane protein YidH (DUF202 family)